MKAFWYFVFLALVAVSSSPGTKTVPSPPTIGNNHHQTTFVAFSVGKTHHQFGPGRVSFEQIFINIGGGFVAAHNVFLAPIAGIYSFQFHGLNHIKAEKKTELFLDLFKNDDYLVSAYESNKQYGTGGNGVLLELAIGDQVDVRNRNADSGLYGTVDQVYATFSGHLIVPIYRVTTFIGGGVDPAQL